MHKPFTPHQLSKHCCRGCLTRARGSKELRFSILVWYCCGALHSYTVPLCSVTIWDGHFLTFPEALPLPKWYLTSKLRSFIHRVSISSSAEQIRDCGQTWFTAPCQADGWCGLWARGKAVSWCRLLMGCLIPGVCHRGEGALCMFFLLPLLSAEMQTSLGSPEVLWWIWDDVPLLPWRVHHPTGCPWLHSGSLGPYLGAGFSQHLIWTLIA